MIEMIRMLAKSTEGWILLTLIAVMAALSALMIALIEASVYEGKEDTFDVGS